MVERLEKAKNVVGFVRELIQSVQFGEERLKFFRTQMLSNLRRVRKDLHLQFDDIASSGEIDTYLNKVEDEVKSLFFHKNKKLKENQLRQLSAGDKQDESDDQSEN